MTRGQLVSIGAAIALGAVGCGDNNAKQCDPDTTMDVNGVCVGNGGGAGTCSDGTILVGDHCEIDPNACQDGTVLVGTECVDPGHVTADIDEAAEPNGLGLLGEISTTPAGTITIKPEGEHFVIHGTIVPFQDADGDGQKDGDIDSYIVDVSGPVMLNVTADGLHGLAGGFVSVAIVNGGPLLDWTRFAVNPTGDTSARKLYLPAAGTYVIAIADTRTLFLTGAGPGAAEGEPDLEYYVTIDQVSAAPTALPVTGGIATSAGTMDPGDVKLFTVEMGEGINSAELSVAIDQVQESLLVTNSRAGTITARAYADGDPGDANPATGQFLGIRTGDETTVVVDSVFDYANAPYDYTLSIKAGSAGALSMNGGNVAQPSTTTDFSVFYYDVAPGEGLVGMDIAFDRPVAGLITDEDFFIFSNFTFDPDPFFGGFAGTFTDYKGLLNHALPGRYYFVVFDPDSGTDDIVATSTYGAVTATTITKGTALADQAANAYNSTPFTYSPGAGTDPWQAFTASGSGTGDIVAFFYDSGTAFGRLDELDNTCGTSCEDSPPALFTHTYHEAGTTNGRIVIDDPAMMLVTVHAETTTGTPMFTLDFEPRVYTDLGMAMAGTDITRTSQPLDSTTPVQRYLVKSDPGSTLTMTLQPGLSLGVTLAQLDRDEAVLDSDTGAVGAQVELEVVQDGSGWTAYEVTSGTTLLDTTFDLTLSTVAPPYTQSAGTTTFSDACNGGSVVTMDDNDEGMSTAPIAAPAGFELFGTPVTDFNVFSNGFISFDAALACRGLCFYSNGDIPSAADPNAIIAPYWDDIVVDTVCQKTSGTKLTIQWTGTLYSTGESVQFQAILDGSNSTVEFVYGTAQVANGNGATIGIENQDGTEAAKVGFNTSNSATNTLLTPN